MKQEFYIVTLDVSKGSAYEYRKDSEIPTKIEYGRYHDGKFQTGCVEGYFTNIKLHDILFLIKRGRDLEEIEERAQMEYK